MIALIATAWGGILLDDAAVEVRHPVASVPGDALCRVAMAVDAQGAPTASVSLCDGAHAEAVSDALSRWQFRVPLGPEGPTTGTGIWGVRFTAGTPRVFPVDVARVESYVPAAYADGATDLDDADLHCTVHLAVGTDGVPTAATPAACPGPLRATSQQAALLWRFEGREEAFEANLKFRFQLRPDDLAARGRGRAQGLVGEDLPKANLAVKLVDDKVAFPPGIKPKGSIDETCWVHVKGKSDGTVDDIWVDPESCEEVFAVHADETARGWTFATTKGATRLQPFVQAWRIHYAQGKPSGRGWQRKVTVKRRRTVVPHKRYRPVWPAEALVDLGAPDCRVAVSVAPNGGLDKAEPRDCPEILHAPLLDSLRKWRWRPLYFEGRMIAFQTSYDVDWTDGVYWRRWDVKDTVDAPARTIPAWPADRPARSDVQQVPFGLTKVEKTAPISVPKGKDVPGDGTCAAMVWIGDDGAPFHVEPTKACPELLHWGVYESVMTWRFAPVVVGDGPKPVAFETKLKIR